MMNNIIVLHSTDWTPNTAIVANGDSFWAPTRGLGNNATVLMLNWHAGCPLLPTAYSDLNWMKG